MLNLSRAALSPGLCKLHISVKGDGLMRHKYSAYGQHEHESYVLFITFISLRQVTRLSNWWRLVCRVFADQDHPYSSQRSMQSFQSGRISFDSNTISDWSHIVCELDINQQRLTTVNNFYPNRIKTKQNKWMLILELMRPTKFCFCYDCICFIKYCATISNNSCKIRR